MANRALVPQGEEVYLDHVGLFVSDFTDSTKQLEAFGFNLTPFVAHASSTQPGQPEQPSGTGNRCAMFCEGYLEVLAATADTPLARQLRTQLARYPGFHLIAFAANHPEDRHAAVAARGLNPLPLVRLARPIAVEQGEQTARFSVIRVPPDVMPEGRVQIVTHHTPHLVWQSQYCRQPNGTQGLTGVLLCVARPREAAGRFGALLDVSTYVEGDVFGLGLQRGRIVFASPERVQKWRPDLKIPTVPYIVEVSLRVQELETTKRFLEDKGFPLTTLEPGMIRVPGEALLGASFVLHDAAVLPYG